MLDEKFDFIAEPDSAVVVIFRQAQFEINVVMMFRNIAKSRYSLNPRYFDSEIRKESFVPASFCVILCK